MCGYHNCSCLPIGKFRQLQSKALKLLPHVTTCRVESTKIFELSVKVFSIVGNIQNGQSLDVPHSV